MQMMIMEDGYMLAITALLPLAAAMVITQKNPYHALVMRGILGALAALIYALFGAADVALTEALVGTMLSITLYAIAVRSSMTMKLGVLEDNESTQSFKQQEHYRQLLSNLQKSLRTHYLSLEKTTYSSAASLQDALDSKAIHATCTLIPESETYQLYFRVPRLYELLKAHLCADGGPRFLVAENSATTTQLFLTESSYKNSSKA